MIDIKGAVEEFIKYSEKFDLTNENIKRKQIHSIRVMNISKQIAESLKLSKQEIELACLIGLLHDIARFKQYTEYKTYKDADSFDHGDIGVKLLKTKNFIRKFVKEEKYDNIIYKSIKNHNKFKIEEGLSKEELLFSRIIRDADKIDIIFQATCIFYIGEEEIIENSYITDKIYDQFNNKSLIKREKNQKLDGVDKVLSIIAFIFDINFKRSFEIIEQKDYINKIINRFNYKNEDTKIKMKKIEQLLNSFIKENY